MKVSAGITVGLAPNPAVVGQSVRITANMAAAATGTVQFTDGPTLLATVPVSAGSATFSTTTLARGSHTLGVAYSGDATYMSASTTVPETVLAASTLTLISNLNPSLVGQSVAFTASVTPSTATGTVQFLDAGMLIGTGHRFVWRRRRSRRLRSPRADTPSRRSTVAMRRTGRRVR